MAGMLTQALHLHFCWNIRSDSGIRRQIVEFNLIKLEDHLRPAIIGKCFFLNKKELLYLWSMFKLYIGKKFVFVNPLKMSTFLHWLLIKCGLIFI